MASERAAAAGVLRRPRLVIFDFDGVIADSETIALEELAAEMTARGAETSYEQARALFLGMSTARHMAYISEKSGRPCAPDFPDVWHGRLFSRYSTELVAVTGVHRTLNLLDRLGIDYCIASGGSVERIRFALDCLGLASRFEGRAFSAEMVARGKPAPDLFLHAAAARSTSPHECLVVEDAPSGVMAAVAAEMPCAAFLGGSHLDPIRTRHRETLIQAGATACVGDHAELQVMIEAR
ncbi:HAD family hydrolase [Mycoplana rhizolycopersici]|jgi:beta-phosphoglucomutase-like phosphatase (HAD superfamily)|uniref:HAD-IA family hydrolase n=1 Tax=Mycoplana rhizolycopersici TaxID=2746702 RepID=A0ABX2QJ92_9HYPH|nr:HAD-IA family hydrolase [Rhizobium rhizolycopersici]NVP57416.1 HAD-IA family hydrolase [Rhizobium rhizolycopersici]